MFGKINSIIENVIIFLEKERFNLLTLFIWIFALSAIRMWTEAVLFNYAYKELTFSYIFMHVHIISFYFTVFLGGILIIKLFSKAKLSKIVNLTACGFVMILLPPFIDRFIFNRTDVYTYIPVEKLFDAFTSFFLKLGTAVGGYGLAIELISIIAFTTIYVYIKTKSIPKAVLSFSVFYIFIPLIATPNINPLIAQWSQGGSLVQPVLILRYIILSIIFLLIIFKISKKDFLSSFIKTIRPFTTLHAVIMVITGVLVAGYLQIDLMNIVDFSHAGNIGTLGISIFITVFLWQSTLMINQIYDLEIDKISNKNRLLPKGLMTLSQAKKIAIIYAVIALGLAFTLSIYAVLLAIFAIALGLLYSIQSFRLRNSIFSTAIIGLGSLIGYLIGYFTPTVTQKIESVLVGIVMQPKFTLETSVPTISIDAIIIGLIIFINLSIGPLITDLKDYEGDKKSGVKSIYTVYGREKGIKIASMLLLLTFLSPLILFHTKIYDFLVFIPIGIVAAIVFKKYNKSNLIFLLYFPILIFCILRWVNFL